MTRPGDGHGIVKPEVIALNGVLAEHPIEQMAQHFRVLLGVEHVLRQVRNNDGNAMSVVEMGILDVQARSSAGDHRLLDKKYTTLSSKTSH